MVTLLTVRIKLQRVSYEGDVVYSARTWDIRKGFDGSSIGGSRICGGSRGGLVPTRNPSEFFAATSHELFRHV